MPRSGTYHLWARYESAAMRRGFEAPERLFHEYLREQGVRPAEALDRDELAAYAMAAGRYDWWSHYYLLYPDGCSFIGYPELFGAIRRTSYNLGAVEDRLLDSEVAPARVAVGWSVTTDIWDAALRDWVAGGGTLVSVAGGGLRDHYGEPLDLLNEVFGIRGARLRKEARALRAKAELLHAEPLDMIRFNGGDRMPVYGYLQTLEPDGAEVLGRFRDGSAAVVANA